MNVDHNHLAIIVDDAQRLLVFGASAWQFTPHLRSKALCHYPCCAAIAGRTLLLVVRVAVIVAAAAVAPANC